MDQTRIDEVEVLLVAASLSLIITISYFLIKSLNSECLTKHINRLDSGRTFKFLVDWLLSLPGRLKNRKKPR